MSTTAAIRAVTFDLDDTLWDIWPTIERAEQRLHEWLQQRYPELTARYTPVALREFRRQVIAARPDIAHDMSLVRQEGIRMAAQEVGYVGTRVEVEAAFAVFHAARNDVLFFADALPTLTQLVGRYALAALSNGNADLGHIGIDHLFVFALNAIDVGQPKPHPAMFKAALAQLGLAPEQVVHVGDDPEKDIYGAAQVGLRTVWVNRRGQAWPAHLACSPDAEVSTLVDLAALLETW